MKTIIRNTTMAISSFLLIAGCQSPGNVTSTESSITCPICKTETVTLPVKGLAYTRHVCPQCKTIETDASKTSSAMASYTSMNNETVHVCQHCKSVVMPCPLCSKQ